MDQRYRNSLGWLIECMLAAHFILAFCHSQPLENKLIQNSLVESKLASHDKCVRQPIVMVLSRMLPKSERRMKIEIHYISQ